MVLRATHLRCSSRYAPIKPTSVLKLVVGYGSKESHSESEQNDYSVAEATGSQCQSKPSRSVLSFIGRFMLLSEVATFEVE